MLEVLADLSPRALSEANQENWAAFLRAMAQFTPDARIQDRPDLACCHGRTRHPLTNCIFRTRLRPDRIPGTVADLCADYGALDRTPMWMLWPNDEPPALAGYLTDHGWTPEGQEVCMAMDLEQLPRQPYLPPGLTLTRVESPADLQTLYSVAGPTFHLNREITETFLAVTAAPGFGPDSPFVGYIGWCDGRPVATARLFLGAGVAGIYTVATLPEYRRRGFGTALTTQALCDARDRHYRIGVLQASEAGAPVYAAMGFFETGKRSLFLYNPDCASH